MKSRNQKKLDYENKYSEIPTNLKDRLNYMCDKYNVKESAYDDIISTMYRMMDNLSYTDIDIILYEEPEGAMRPRSRIINKKNYMNEAITNSQFIHVYSPNAKSDNVYMKRLVEKELYNLSSLIYTPCIVHYKAFLKTPSNYNTKQKFLCELGLVRPDSKPDWDNIGKKYSDMYNSNVWIDDALTISGTVDKYYSILPRVEIRLKYLNALYNKYQYNKLINKKQYGGEPVNYIDNYGNITTKEGFDNE